MNKSWNRLFTKQLLFYDLKKFIKEKTHFCVHSRLQTRVPGQIFFKRSKKPFKYYIRKLGGSEIVHFCLPRVHRVSGWENPQKTCLLNIWIVPWYENDYLQRLLLCSRIEIFRFTHRSILRFTRSAESFSLKSTWEIDEHISGAS